MITRYPILEFLSVKVGTYRTVDGKFELELRKNGYDFVLLTKGSPSRSQIYGVIGVAGENLELHASMGLPNIITFTWPYALEETSNVQEICLRESDEHLSIGFLFEAESLIFTLTIGGKEKAKYVLQKA
uniref:hypothetical protein n=1 Tax=Thaumasiovibrio occultus TaxID=1891184 RepID=UPI000B34FCBE|nr:hypothetical protein [Thaumasiovibrio occultus]